MSLESHNLAEIPDVQQVIDNEIYLLGERLGRDPRCNLEDLRKAMDIACSIILEGGFGEHMAKTAPDINIENIEHRRERSELS